MKCLRLLVFLIAVGGFPGFLSQAHGQQEIDPDHFDQPAAKAVTAPKPNARTASVHGRPSRTRVASKSAGGRVYHRRVHPSA